MRRLRKRQASPKRRAPVSKLSALPTSAVLASAAAVLLGSGAVAVSVSPPDSQPPSSDAVLTANLADSIVDTTPRHDDSGAEAAMRTLAISRATDREAAAQREQQQAEQAARRADRRRDALAELAEKTRAEAARIDSTEWVLPTAGYTLTATFGESSGLWSTSHTGLDFAAPAGTRVVAVSGGTITSTAYDGAYGNRTILTLTDGTEIWYCHQTSFVAKEGQTVAPGELIGYVGSTGNSTGPHLHLEVRPGGRNPTDPYAALAAHGLRP
jgi:murein DD-endopeptidase MepM/ murein hydrolase activator NlpD